MAISFDNAVDLGQSTLINPFTVSYTCTGKDRTLLVGIVGEGGDFITSVTYGGVAMTQVAKINLVDVHWVYLYILVGPASGSNSITINASTTNVYDVVAASYRGTIQTVKDNSTSGSATADHVTTAITPVADNCWVVHYTVDTTSSSGYTYTNLTQRLGGGSGVVADSNTIIHPAASFTGTITVTGVSQTWAAFVVSLQPSPSPLSATGAG